MAGFHGITDSQRLRSKYFRDLNDSTEVFHIRDKLEELLVPVVKAEIRKRRRELKKAIKEFSGMGSLARDQARVALNAFFDVAFGSEEWKPTFSPYITSFCAHTGDKEYEQKNGLLSMWRSYANGGVALVFDTVKLEECLIKESDEHLYNFGGLGDVVYGGDEKVFLAEFEGFIEPIKKHSISLLIDRSNFKIEIEFVHSFINIATRYKHQAFEEEREVRMVFSPWNEEGYIGAESDEIKGRKLKVPIVENGSTYIELFDGQTVSRLPIVKVIVGPHRDQEKHYDEVRTKLKHRKDIEVVRSETPYIGK